MTYESLKRRLLNLTGVAEDDFDPDGDLIDFGLDSLQVLDLIEEWSEQGIDVDLASLAEERTLNGWWRLLGPKIGAQP